MTKPSPTKKNTTFSPTNKSRPTIHNYTVSLTDQQQDELMKLGALMNAEDIPNFLSRCISLGKIVGNGLAMGCELVMVNTKKATIYDQEDNKTVALVSQDNGEGIVFVTNDMKKAVEFQEEIKRSNNWGTPFDSSDYQA